MEDLEFQLVPPLFGALEQKLPISEYAVRGKSFGDFLSFLFRVGLPLRLHSDLNLLICDGKELFGLVPEPARIISRFKAEFENLLYLGLMLPLEGRPNVLSAEKLLEQK